MENGLSLVNSRTRPSYPCCLVTSPRAAVKVIPFTSQVNSVLPGRFNSVKNYILNSSKLISLFTCKYSSTLYPISLSLLSLYLSLFDPPSYMVHIKQLMLLSAKFGCNSPCGSILFIAKDLRSAPQKPSNCVQSQFFKGNYQHHLVIY